MNRYHSALLAGMAALFALPVVTTFTSPQRNYHARTYTQPDPYSVWRIVDDDVDIAGGGQTWTFNYVIPQATTNTLYTLTHFNFTHRLSSNMPVRIYSEGQLVWASRWITLPALGEPFVTVQTSWRADAHLEWLETPLVLNGRNISIEIDAIDPDISIFNQQLMLMGRRSSPFMDKLNVFVESEGVPEFTGGK